MVRKFSSGPLMEEIGKEDILKESCNILGSPSQKISE